MYNKELKRKFLEECLINYEYALKKISEAERFYDKNIFDFTTDELDDAFRSIRSKTLTGVRGVVSPVKIYIDWAIQQGYSKSKVNLVNLLMGENLKKYVSAYAYQNSFIDRNELFAISEKIVNPVDQAMIVLPFEGIFGKDALEMRTLKKENIDIKTGAIKVSDGQNQERIVMIQDRRTLEILKAAISQTEYMASNGESNRSRTYELKESPYLLAAVNKAKDPVKTTEMLSSFVLQQKVKLFFKGIRNKQGEYEEPPYIDGHEFLNLTNLYKSGFFSACYEIEHSKGSLSSDDYDEVCTRFGVNQKNKGPYELKYKDWKENYLKERYRIEKKKKA